MSNNEGNAIDQLRELGGAASVKMLEEAIDEVKKEATKQMDEHLQNYRETWDRRFNIGILGIAALIVTSAGLTFFTAAQTANKEVNQSVLALQQSILSAQDRTTAALTKMTTSLSDLDKRNEELKTASEKMIKARDELSKVQADFEATRARMQALIRGSESAN